MTTRMIAWLDQWAGSFALETAVAVTLILVVALLVSWVLRRSAASLRHRVWALAILGLLAYPLVQPVLPKLSLGLRMASPERPADVEPTVANPSEPPVLAQESALPVPDRKLATEIATRAGPAAEPLAVLEPPIGYDEGARREAADTAAPAAGFRWPSILAAVWAMGAVIGLGFLGAVHLAAHRLVRMAASPSDPSWSELAAAVAAQLGVRRRVAVKISRGAPVPVTAGWLRPTILLPSDCDQWPTPRRRMVLIHEMSHVARGDVLWQFAAKFACVVYWPHPLVWLAGRRMRVEREAACDDAVLRDVERPSEYASLLLDVAASLADRPPIGMTTAIAMACGRSVEERIRWIVQPGRCRLPVSRRTARWFSIGAILIVLAVGSISLFAGPPAPVAAAASSQVQADDAKRNDTNEKTKSISAAMESSLEGLPKLYESVSKSIVRVERTGTLNVTGVIVSSEGHILADGFGSDDSSIWGDRDMKVHLSDGRTVTAKAAGWSSEWRLAVMKINEEGPWPAIKLGSTKDLKAGEPCLVIGYSPRGDTRFDSSPAARFGFIDRSVPTRWFTTTCFPGYFERPAVVGMDGRLLGIDNFWAGDQSYETAVDVFVANRDVLFAGKNLDWVRYPPKPDSIYHIGAGEHPEMLSLRKTDDVLGAAKPPARMSDSQLSEVKQIAKKTTVRLVSKERLSGIGKAYVRWSGVIVSEDGYILTSALQDQLPGEQLTVRLSDGRDADAVALGTNPITDIGLVKITTPGSWPFAEIAASSTLKPGDPLVVAGYRAYAKGEGLTERTPEIDATAVEHRLYMLWFNEGNTNYIPTMWSGGGVFNRYGRYVGAGGGSSFKRSEVAKAQWDDLKQIKSIDTATGLPHPLRRRFVAPSKAVAQSVVELLVDSKPVGIGTIVDAGGWILTKASVLDGKVRCRLPDQSVVIAEKRAASQEHDLALLKIDVGGLSAAGFSDKEPPSIAQVLCAVGPRQVLKPGIVSIETRAIPPEPRWEGNATEDTPDGPMIARWSDGRLGWQCLVNLSTIGTKLQTEDIIVSINGHSTPNVGTLTQVLEANLPGYCTGDLVSVAIRRKGSPMNVLTPLPPATVVKYWMMDKHDTPRRSGFAAVFDTDIELLQREVGCPVIDVEGRIRGIAIASRGRNETQRGPTSVLPSRIVSRVTKQLMAETHSE